MNDFTAQKVKSIILAATLAIAACPSCFSYTLPEEKAMLKEIAARERVVGADSPEIADLLPGLAALYKGGERWDEYSVVRSLMLVNFKKDNPDVHGPLPGGPFPRIGKPGYNSLAMKPPSYLSHWLNKVSLPEFYAPAQVGFDDQEKIYKQTLSEAVRLNAKSLKVADCLDKLAAYYCARLLFAKAKPLYEKALQIRLSAPNRDHSAPTAELKYLAQIDCGDIHIDPE